MSSETQRLVDAEKAWAEFVQFIAEKERNSTFEFRCPHFQKLDLLLGEGLHHRVTEWGDWD